MPPAEKQYLGFSFDVQLDGEDYAVNNVSRLRTAYLYLDISHPTLPTNTIRQIWGATIGALDKAQKKVLTTNEVALRAFGREFERLLVDAAKSTSTPARNYKKVAEKIVLANVADALTGFEMVHKQRLTKKDKEDVAILGAALERSLQRGDDLYEARMGRIDKAIEAEKNSPVFATVDDDEDTPF